MAWALQFDGVNDYAVFSEVSLDADFNITLTFKTPSALLTQVIIGKQLNTADFIAIFSDGTLGVKISNVSLLPRITGIIASTVYTLNVVRISGNVTASIVSGDSRVYSNTGHFTLDQLGSGGSSFNFGGYMEKLAIDSVINLDAAASDHSNTGAQPVLIDTIGGNNATGVNMPTDGSAWIDLGGGTPSFNPAHALNVNNLIGGF